MGIKKRTMEVKRGRRPMDAEAVTKLGMLLKERGISQSELCKMVCDRTGVVILFPQMNLMVTGKHKNPTVSKLKAIADTLEVSMDDICEFDYLQEDESE